VTEKQLLELLLKDPNNQENLYRLGNIYQDSGRNRQAAAVYRRLLDLNPNLVDAQINFGTVSNLLGRHDEALTAIQKGLAMRPDLAMGWFRLADVQRTKGDIDGVLASLRRAVHLSPEFSKAWANLGTALRDTAQLDEAMECYDRALAITPEQITTADNRVFSLYYHPAYDVPEIYQEHLKWDRQYAQPLRGEILPLANDRNPDRRLRIGYVSPDFRWHCQAMFTIPVLSHHDHDQFEIFCYSDARFPDSTTQRIQGFADQWRTITDKSDADAARMIHEDRIDILIDLTMHMAAARPLVFARKPAPVQVAWLAYPGTTGMSVIDYRLTDPRLDPPGLNDEFYSEKTIRLPDTFWCYDPLADQPEVNELPAIGAGHVTFGCLNNFCKINSPWLAVWARVFKAVPTSRFILLAPRGTARERILRELKIDPARVDFADLAPRPEYLKRYLQIDLALDTYPYNGHTTSLDALWMGVPIVSRHGRTAASRAGLSQSFHVGLSDCVAEDPDGFVRIAVELANDLARLAEIRGTLRGRMEKSPLMDGKTFTSNLETVYRRIWRDWCKTA
jgi:protein O-GlcNAc transferase